MMIMLLTSINSSWVICPSWFSSISWNAWEYDDNDDDDEEEDEDDGMGDDDVDDDIRCSVRMSFGFSPAEPKKTMQPIQRIEAQNK